MSLFLLGVLIALALLIFGKELPQIQVHPKLRYFLAVLVLAGVGLSLLRRRLDRG